MLPGRGDDRVRLQPVVQLAQRRLLTALQKIGYNFKDLENADIGKCCIALSLCKASSLLAVAGQPEMV